MATWIAVAAPSGIGSAEDSRFRSGRVVYTTRFSDEGRRFTLRATIVYSPTTSLQTREYVGEGRPKGVLRTTYFIDGGNGLELIDRQDGTHEVTLARNRVWAPQTDHRFAIVAGPSYPLGAGFASDAAEAASWKFGDSELVSKEGSHIHFEYGALGIHRVLRLFRPGVGTEHIYEGSMDAGNGVRVPRRYTDRIVGSGPEGIKSFDIEKADFKTPVTAKDVAATWYAPGTTINDVRVEPSVGWTYEELVRATGKTTGLTLEELLKLSEERAVVFRRDYARKLRHGAQTNSDGPAPTTIIAVVFLGVFSASAGYFLIKNRVNGPVSAN